MDIRKIIKFIDIEIKVLGVGLIYKFILLYFQLYNRGDIFFNTNKMEIIKVRLI